MFLETTIKRNPELISYAQQLCIPDTYVIDVDSFIENAKMILQAAADGGIESFFMLKQVGRNPYLAHKLLELGYPGAVAVDFKEAKSYIDNGVHICNVGHLVQIPKNLVVNILRKKPDFITCFSKEKIDEINCVAKELGIIQKVLVRVVGQNDVVYPGQEGGFKLNELQFPKYSNVEIAGVTSFPCFLNNEPTPNLQTLKQAKDILGVSHVNAPSCNCIVTANMIHSSLAHIGVSSIEPGHALTGTTPVANQPEKPSVVYVSEISHIYDEKSYVYGGGFYRRGHTNKALVGNEVVEVECPPDNSIDYYFKVLGKYPVSSPVVMAFRFQIFVTRSNVALVEGLGSNPRLVGIYSSLGEEIHV